MRKGSLSRLPHPCYLSWIRSHVVTPADIENEAPVLLEAGRAAVGGSAAIGLSSRHPSLRFGQSKGTLKIDSITTMAVTLECHAGNAGRRLGRPIRLAPFRRSFLLLLLAPIPQMSPHEVQSMRLADQASIYDDLSDDRKDTLQAHFDASFGRLAAAPEAIARWIKRLGTLNRLLGK
jgi:hypothetical protein